MDKKVTPGEIVVMAGGALVLIGSFLPFYKVDFGPGFDDDTTSAWGEGLFPVATLIVLFAVVAGGLVALTTFANANLGRGVLGFGYGQLLLALGFFSAILALAFLLVEKGETDFGFGYYLVLIGAVGAFVGTIIMTTEARRAMGPGIGGSAGTPPPPPPPAPPPPPPPPA
jgi:hypothetical protein